MVTSIETELPNLAGVNLLELSRRRDLDQEREALIAQVERPRLNIGSGPPGRAD
jgi:hypothetical protein